MAGDRWEVAESSLGRSFAKTRPRVCAAWKELGSCLQSLGQGCTHRQEFLRLAGAGTEEGERAKGLQLRVWSIAEFPPSTYRKPGPRLPSGIGH